MFSLRVLALIVLAIVSGSQAAVASDGPSYSDSEHSTGILVSAMNQPLVNLGSDGANHIAYDLQVTNIMPADLTLTSIEVLSEDGESLLLLADDDLAAATQSLIGTSQSTTIRASSAIAVVIDIAVPMRNLPGSITNRLTYAYGADQPAAALIGTTEILGPTLSLDAQSPFVLSAPLAGDGWFALNACCEASSVHRYVRAPVDGDRWAKPEIFAIDWVRLEQGAISANQGDQLSDWYAYGAEVLAVGDGEVVYVRDVLPEQTPNQPVRDITVPEDFAGNQVIIQLGEGVYALYGHLQPGSITVAIGDRVQTGQPIGRLGNSGNSTAPHLHFGLYDRPNGLTATSVPMVIDTWILEGMADPATVFGEEPQPIVPEGGSSQQTETFPLWMSVATFSPTVPPTASPVASPVTGTTWPSA
jgi:murein DD-endopeptidase MepM/ murein hydrolase activator NlpD